MTGLLLKNFFFYFACFLLFEACCRVSARPNTSFDSPKVLRSHYKGKRAWDLPYASDTPDEPIISVVAENQVEKTEIGSESNKGTDGMWLDIGRDFQEKKEVPMNSDGLLECEAVGSPPPKVLWLRNGMPVESMTIVTNDENVKNRVEVGNNVIYEKFGSTGMANVKARLSIKCAQPEDQGHYTCVAINKGKQITATTHMTVIDEDPQAPRGSCEYRSSMMSFKKSKKGSSAFIIGSESFHMETMGKNIALPCKFVGKPRPKVTWLDQDGKKITSGKKYQVSSSGSLVIRNLAWRDMGVYTCVVENIFGTDSVTTFVYPLSSEEETIET